MRGKIKVTVWKPSASEVEAMVHNARRVLSVVESVENRCMAADGDVTPTLQEMTERELRVLWLACAAIAEPMRRKA